MVDRLSVRLSCLIYSCINVIYKPLIAFAWSPLWLSLLLSAKVISCPISVLFIREAQPLRKRKNTGRIFAILSFSLSVILSKASWSLRDGLNVQTAGNVQLTSQRSAEGYPSSKGCCETFLWINSCTRSELEEKLEMSHGSLCLCGAETPTYLIWYTCEI